MKAHTFRSLVVLFGGLLLAQQAALAQKINQPWSAPRGAHESRVISCTNGTPPAPGLMALDDWICPASGALTGVQWWGVVSAPAQRFRHYYVSIWNHNPATCRPNNRIYQTCVTPASVAVGHDCRGRTVYRFSAPLAPAFTQVVGTHYWLQISEDDLGSVTPGVVDFRWSSCLPIALCPAVQISAGGVFTQPIPDDCIPPIFTDLAFRIYATVIVGLIPIPLTPPTVFLLQVQDTTGAVLETYPVEPSDDGSFMIETELPPGQYAVEMVGMGLTGMRGTLNLQQNAENRVMLSNPCLGDFNQDGRLNSEDFFDFLQAFFAGCP